MTQAKLHAVSNILIDVLESEMTGWNLETRITNDTQTLRFFKGSATITVFVCFQEGEEGFSLSCEWVYGLCRQEFRGISAKNAERTVKAAVAKAVFIDQLTDDFKVDHDIERSVEHVVQGSESVGENPAPRVVPEK